MKKYYVSWFLVHYFIFTFFDKIFIVRYNCDDIHCYHDIARLRGVKYITWEKTELLTSHNEVSE